MSSCLILGLTDDIQACVNGLRVVDQSPTQISIAWNLPTTSCRADYLQVQYRILNEEQCRIFTEEAFTSLPRINAESTTTTIFALEPFSTYLIKVTPRRDATGEGPIELVTHSTSSAG